MRVNPELLLAALQGLEVQRSRIVEQIAEVRQVLGSRDSGSGRRGKLDDWESPLALAGAATRKRPRLSAEARKRISEAQKKRWAALKVRKGRR
jgi:hypothetical protein